MRNKTTLLLTFRLNEIIVARNKPNVTFKELQELDDEFNKIVYELWSRYPNLKRDGDLQPQKKLSNLILIAAIGKNNELGKDNKLIWHLKEDLKFFKEQTKGKKIVMGYNTYISLPSLLEDREHIVLTHRNIEFPEEVKVYHDKQLLIEELKKLKEEIYIIGGASIYSQFIEYSDQLILTEIDSTYKEADAYFPYFDRKMWNRTLLSEKEEKGIKYKHVKYKRK